MNMKFLGTADNIHVRIDSFHLSKTYAGLLEGVPDREVNKEIVESFTRSLQDVWGSRTLLVVWPREEDTSSPAEVLPDWICAAWFTSDFSPCSGDHGSELVVVWFEACLANEGIEAIVAKVLQRLDWKAHASGFIY